MAFSSSLGPLPRARGYPACTCRGCRRSLFPRVRGGFPFSSSGPMRFPQVAPPLRGYRSSVRPFSGWRPGSPAVAGMYPSGRPDSSRVRRCPRACGDLPRFRAGGQSVLPVAPFVRGIPYSSFSARSTTAADALILLQIYPSRRVASRSAYSVYPRACGERSSEFPQRSETEWWIPARAGPTLPERFTMWRPVVYPGAGAASRPARGRPCGDRRPS